jgi:hypothetical protein
MGGLRREVFATIARGILRQKYQKDEKIKHFAAKIFVISSTTICFITI